MSYRTYSEISVAVANWLVRSDLSSFVGDFINQAEDRLANELRIRAIEKDLSVAMSGGTAAVPSDFLELKHARLALTPTYALEPQDTQWILRQYPHRTANSRPRYIGVDGDSFIFGPFPDTAYTVEGTYYFKPTLLSASNETNEWTDNTPDALFYGTLLQSMPFIGNDKRIPTWNAYYQRAVDGYSKTDRRKARRGSRMNYN